MSLSSVGCLAAGQASVLCAHFRTASHSGMQNPFSHQDCGYARGAVVHELQPGGNQPSADGEPTVSRSSFDLIVMPSQHVCDVLMFIRAQKKLNLFLSRLKNKRFPVVEVTQTAVINEVTQQHLDNLYTCIATNSIGSSTVTVRLKQRLAGSIYPPGSFPYSPKVCLNQFTSIKEHG